MNWNYISGFFDADGSITFTRPSIKQQKTPQLTFSNNELHILEEIQEFIFNTLNIKGFISIKRAQKETHNDNYELKYLYLPKILKILPHINSLHPKKQYRIHLILTELSTITPRNGKYTEELLNKRMGFDTRFFSTFQ